MKVDDDGNGQLVTKITGDLDSASGADFTNTYAAASAKVQFSGTKTLAGRDLKAGEFSFTLTGEGLDETVKNDESGAFSFDSIEYDTPGTYKYTVKENKGNLGGVTYDTKTYDVIVTVTDNGEGQLVAKITGDLDSASGADFTNTYAAASAKVQFSGEKTLDGRTLDADEFSFTLCDADGNEIKTVTNDAEGKIVFPEISYDKVGTYAYTVAENNEGLGGVEYDTNEYEVTVTVEDDGNGQLVASIEGLNEDGSGADFTNTYAAANTQVQFSGTKTLTGRDLKANEFSFTLYDGDGNEIETVTNDGQEGIVFSELDYNAPGEYSYTISENQGDSDDIMYDDSEYQVTVQVTDNREGSLVANVSGLNEDGTGADFENEVIEEESEYDDETDGDSGADKDAEDSGKGKGVGTGDSNLIEYCLLLMLISLAGAFAAVRTRRRS